MLRLFNCIGIRFEKFKRAIRDECDEREQLCSLTPETKTFLPLIVAVSDSELARILSGADAESRHRCVQSTTPVAWGRGHLQFGGRVCKRQNRKEARSKSEPWQIQITHCDRSRREHAPRPSSLRRQFSVVPSRLSSCRTIIGTVKYDEGVMFPLHSTLGTVLARVFCRRACCSALVKTIPSPFLGRSSHAVMKRITLVVVLALFQVIT